MRSLIATNTRANPRPVQHWIHFLPLLNPGLNARKLIRFCRTFGSIDDNFHHDFNDEKKDFECGNRLEIKSEFWSGLTSRNVNCDVLLRSSLSSPNNITMIGIVDDCRHRYSLLYLLKWMVALPCSCDENLNFPSSVQYFLATTYLSFSLNKHN